MIKISNRIALLFALLTVAFLAGCAADPRNLSSSDIVQRVRVVSSEDGHGLNWSAPELRVSHYRSLFYGYDNVDYRLIAEKSREPSVSPIYHLTMDAHYGGNVRRYDQAKWPNGRVEPIIRQSHRVERCQFFNNLVYSCLYRDRLSVQLAVAELEAHRNTGLALALGSPSSDYEHIDLPARYIEGFLQAVAGLHPNHQAGD